MQTQTAELESINQASYINLTLSWIVMVRYELVADWENPDFLIEAHPMVLLKQSTIPEAIIRWCHENVAHGGRGMPLNNLKQNGFWILSCNVVVRGMIYRCVNCRKLCGKFGVHNYLKLDALKYHHLHTVGSICLDHTPSGKGDLT